MDLRGLRHLGISWSSAERMMENEVRAYGVLGERGAQGLLVPRFVFRGPDLAFMWAVVTSYEGVSLQGIVDAAGGLPRELKAKAAEALRALHDIGVVHGDVELRNAV